MRGRLWTAGIVMALLWPGYGLALELSGEPVQPITRLNVDAQKVALGKKLFFDVRLSQNQSISCAHCHDLEEHGGADGLKHSFGVEGREGAVNSPTVFNAALNFAQFWDGRATTLEEQVDGPVTGHVEMASSWPEVVSRLAADDAFRNDFNRIYPTGLTADNIKNAIAEYERTLLTPGSRFDRYLNGDEAAITADEKRGYRLFKSYGCVACHQGRNVGGNLFQVLGVMGDYFADYPAENSAGRGRFNVTGLVEDMHRFKVPSLRLAVLTAPYFHNGSAKTLAEAIRVMSKYQLGRDIPDDDLRAIIAFLYTLPGSYAGHSLEPSDREQLNFTPATALMTP
ncbi:cytochrome-c peroxidase [Mariprofundus erugo]|uniref:cytochrome-c peroxidase n=1 Tax=Mariprofundus erugo TaxID=2528639 RepID=UPI0019310BC2|nr:cytochrome-c peroxidase [Mariprofundus erugo]